MINKKDFLLKKIENMSDNELDLMYNFIAENDAIEEDKKWKTIYQGILPFISFMYFSLDQDQLDLIFGNKAM